jgi:hypothetical protein
LGLNFLGLNLGLSFGLSFGLSMRRHDREKDKSNKKLHFENKLGFAVCNDVVILQFCLVEIIFYEIVIDTKENCKRWML